MLKQVASLWIGNKLGPVELASICSFRRQGHDFTLFSYEPIGNCPADVILRDAREILDVGQSIRHHKAQSAALHSDFFRHAFIAKTDFVWVDLDIVALRPFDFPSDHIFAYEAEHWLNVAVLKLPHQSPALAKLAEIHVGTKGVPPHLFGIRKLRYGLRNLLAGGGRSPAGRGWPFRGPGRLSGIGRAARCLCRASLGQPSQPLCQ